MNKLLLLIPSVRRQQVLLERAMIRIQNEFSDTREEIEENMNDDEFWNSPETRKWRRPEQGWEIFPLASKPDLRAWRDKLAKCERMAE